METTAGWEASKHPHSVSAFRSMALLKPSFMTAPSDCPAGYHAHRGTGSYTHWQNTTKQFSACPRGSIPSSRGQRRAGGSLKVCDSTFRTELEVHPCRDGFGDLCSADVQVQRWQYDAGINGHASNHLEQTQFVTNKGDQPIRSMRAPLVGPPDQPMPHGARIFGWSRDHPTSR